MTLSEIAEAAGVSTGTVDRVLHNRKGVSPKTKAIIEKIIEENGYHPNILASQLKKGQVLKIGVLLPPVTSGCGYYVDMYKGIKEAAESLEPFKFELIFSTYDRTTPLDLLKKGRELIAQGISGLITAPLVTDEFFELLPGLTNIPYVFIDSPLNVTGPLCTIVQNPYKGGYCVGRIMKMLKGTGTFACIKMYDNAYNLIERERGFTDFIQRDSGSKVLQCTCKDFSEIGIYTYLENLFSEHKDLKGIFIPHTEVQLASYFLINNGLKSKVTLIGYDSTEQNRQALLDGSIDCLIGQRQDIQGYEAVRILHQAINLKKKLSDTMDIPIDIYFRENV